MSTVPARAPAGRAGSPRPKTAGPRNAPAYDYVLAVGPGRSGTTLLYRLLAAHPQFSSPGIKEAHCYRSARRLERALARPRGTGAILLDVADTAWSDPRLVRVSAIAESGTRILVVLLLRRHAERARSLIAYRLSRALPALPACSRAPAGWNARRSATPWTRRRWSASSRSARTCSSSTSRR